MGEQEWLDLQSDYIDFVFGAERNLLETFVAWLWGEP